MPSAARRKSPCKDKWGDVANLLRIVAHPIRLCVLSELSRGAKCVMGIRELIPVPQPVLSQHIAVLRKAELVSNYARGSLRSYYLTRPAYTKSLLEAIMAVSQPRTKPRDEVFAEVDKAIARRKRSNRAKR